MEQGPRVVRDDQVECRGIGRLRAILVVFAALILAVVPVQRTNNLPEVHAQSALPGASDAGVAGLEKVPVKRLLAAVADGEPGPVERSDSSVRLAHFSRIARGEAALLPARQTSREHPPARGPPAPVA